MDEPPLPQSSKGESKHHYLFAHIWLRQIAYAQPAGIFGVLASSSRTSFLDNLLTRIDEKLTDCVPRSFTAADIQFFPCLIDERPCAILQMPPPQKTPEAFFVAIMSRLRVEEVAAAQKKENGMLMAIDYYTLERPLPDAGIPSVFCGWSQDGVHVNYGAGAEPILEAFKKLLEKRVELKPMAFTTPGSADNRDQ